MFWSACQLIPVPFRINTLMDACPGTAGHLMTTAPAASSSRYGSHGSPVSTTAPTNGTANPARSRGPSLQPVMARNRSHATSHLSPELRKLSW